MPSQPRFPSLWGINGRLDRTRRCRQLTAFREAGLDGVVFHPHFYPNDPPHLGDRYLADVSATILHAKSLDMDFLNFADPADAPADTLGAEWHFRPLRLPSALSFR